MIEVVLYCGWGKEWRGEIKDVSHEKRFGQLLDGSVPMISPL
jgi:hypothetical protein